MSKHSNIIEFVIELESRYPVENWHVGGVDIWPLIRILLTARLLVQGDFDSRNQISKYQGRWHLASRMLSTLFRACILPLLDMGKNVRIKKADIVILVASSTRFFKVTDRWYNPYSDSVTPGIEDHGLSAITLETAGDNVFRIPRYRSSKFIQRNISFFQIQAVFFQKFSSVSSEVSSLVGFSSMCAEIEKFSNGKLAINASDIGERVHYLNFTARFFESLLVKIQPKIVLYEGYYSLDRMALALASKRLRIKTIEVQHGVQGPLHLAYANWTKIPSGGYPLMPDYFWVWGEDEEKNINSWSSNYAKVHEAFVGGNPTLSLRMNFDDEKLLQERVRLLTSNCDVVILFTLQAFYSVPEFFLEAVERSPQNWCWLFRCHPQYDEVRRKIEQVVRDHKLNDKVIIDGVSDLPMSILLKVSDVHLTEFSSSVLEAESLGVPSILISERGREIYADQISRGMAFHVSDSAILIETIEKIRKTVPASKRNEFTGSVNAGMVRLLDLIKKQNTDTKLC